MNLLLGAMAAVCVFAFLVLAHAETVPALLLALFGGLLTMRWFARCFAYVQGRMHRAVASDLVYALALMAGLGTLVLGHRVTFSDGAIVLA